MAKPRPLPPMCKECRKKQGVTLCAVITDPWYFWKKHGKCFAFTNDPDWEQKAT